LREWHEDNPPPATVSLGSGKHFKWRCSVADCGHVCSAMPKARSHAPRPTGCVGCHRRSRLKGRGRVPSLAEGRPDLVPEFDEDNNGVLVTEVSCGASRQAWWVCQGCGKSWQTRITHRVTQRPGCCKCRNKIREGDALAE